MSALDQAFIKAYAKEPAPTNAATSGASNETSRASAVAETKSRAPQKHVASTQIENIYSAGSLYRVETPQAVEPVPPPHFASRASRRLPLRYRLAQMETEATPPVAKRIPQPLDQPARAVTTDHAAPSRRRKAQIPPPPTVAFEVQNQVPADEPLPLLPPMAISVEVRERWEELLSESPTVAESALSVWPNQEDFAASQASSLISVDLETMPEPSPAVTEIVSTPVIKPVIETGAPEASPAKTYRLDAAHVAVPSPHQPPEPPQPTVEDLIKPTVEEPIAKVEEAKIPERPLVISEEEAAELVGAPLAPQKPDSASAKTATPALHPSLPLVPAWEVDRFLWPALCEKLLRDDQSYFAQAGGKIASAVRDGLKSLAITGSRRGEGRTTLALCLARSAAKAGLKVALVDADFTRPQLAASLGLEIAASWHDAAFGKTTLAEAAIKSIEENLTVLPLDVSSAAAALSLADPRLTKTLRDVASAFDLLVLDLGPTAAGVDSLFPENEHPPADAAIVVRDLRYCTLAESQAIGERLGISGIEAVGIAENFVPSEKFVA
ncbi:MAG: AAA family ATPase [Pirellulaceae bacterium]